MKIIGVGNVVVHLVERLRPFITDEKLLICLDTIATMPECLEQRKLDEWENLCSLAFPDSEDDPLYCLVEEIYELGRFNLYAGYQQRRAEEEYQKVLTLFRKQNIPGEKPASEVCLAGW